MPALRSNRRDCTKRRLVVAWGRCGFRISDFGLRIAGPDARTRPRSTALTLIEVLLTIAVLAILAGILIPQLSGDLPERLNAASQIIAADLDYARSLAVATGSYDAEALRASGADVVLEDLSDVQTVLEGLGLDSGPG